MNEIIKRMGFYNVTKLQELRQKSSLAAGKNSQDDESVVRSPGIKLVRD